MIVSEIVVNARKESVWRSVKAYVHEMSVPSPFLPYLWPSGSTNELLTLGLWWAIVLRLAGGAGLS